MESPKAESITLTPCLIKGTGTNALAYRARGFAIQIMQFKPVSTTLLLTVAPYGRGYQCESLITMARFSDWKLAPMAQLRNRENGGYVIRQHST